MLKNAIAVSAVLMIITLISRSSADDLKDSALYQSADTTKPELLYPVDYVTRFEAESACTVHMAGAAHWAVSDWMMGDEIYKAYQDPSAEGLNGGYPFQIDAVAIHLQFSSPGTIHASADIEGLHPDLSLPSCPYPGGVIDMSSEQTFHIPRAGGYLLTIVFDEAITVTSPYFCGFYFSNDISAMKPEIVLDNDPYLCVNWNDWGEGYIDLVDNEYYPFPGNLVLFSIGRSGGSTAGIPKVRMAWPPDSSTCSSKVYLRAVELANTIPTTRCSFEYYRPGKGWTVIGEDYNSDVSLRNGIGPSSYQDGYSLSWDVSSLAEGWYQVRATIYDQAQNSGSDTIDIYLDNTPFQPEFTYPSRGDTICDSVTFIMNIPDEDASFVQFEYLEARDTVAIAPALLLQSKYGDTDGDRHDGNYFANGEFGEFYNAPVLVAGYIRYFAEHGFPGLAQTGRRSLTDRDIVEELADSMQIRRNLGAKDDNFIRAVEEYFRRRGNQFTVDLLTSPSIGDLDYIMGYKNGAILTAIGHPYGHWLGFAEIDFSSSTNGLHSVMIYDTRSGTILQSTLRFNPLPEIMYKGSYRTIDLAVAIYPKDSSPSGTVFGLDFDPSDGFGSHWDIPEVEESEYYIAGKGIDNQSHTGERIVRINILCKDDYASGDVNADGNLNVSDAVWIINYVFAGGEEPRPSLIKGDANCDNLVNVSDAIWLMNYVFVGGPPPCS
ncbi:MAG TPA: hypothetical protein ENO22_01250 [candidate division Zixibacteria bacterium]|nr:hypothetical protein [candidate division Zixibacteria bacterium]